MNIVYLILHYMAGADTVECIESILKASEDTVHNIKIVVVDNGSPNDSYGFLQEKYNGNENIVLLHNEDNLGFAKGNNLGFEYAKNNLNADFIVMLNNDTIISQQDFNEVLVRKYEEESYGVLGPDIVTADGYHQNPGSKQGWELSELQIYRLKKRIQKVLCLSSKYANKKANSRGEYRKTTLMGDVKNTILHGACLIFSPIYIQMFDGICKDTFLYMEEDILKLYSDHYGFLMMYSSDLSILHKEDVATDMIVETTSAKMRQKYEYIIQSSKVYTRLKKEFKRQH